jgi:flavodoxin
MGLILMLALLLTSPPGSKDSGATDREVEERTLIVYLSRTKNTEALARIIQKETGGKLVALELLQPYPEHYQTTVNQVAEENRTGYLPPLKTRIDGMAAYDTVYIGFPTWGMQLPPPIKSFLKQYSLSGKTVIPFNTHGGYGAGNSFETVKALCTECHVLPGFSTEGGKEKEGKLLMIKDQKALEVERDVKNWLKKVRK